MPRTKKSVSKSSKKTSKKKTKKTKKKKGGSSSFFDDCIDINDIDELYNYINQVQLQLKSSPKLQLTEDIYFVALNLLKDVGLPYKIYKTKEYLIRIDPDLERDYNKMVDESVNEFIAEFFNESENI